MKLIVGLGNPGKEYINTRHNVGFMVLDNYLQDVKWSEKFNGLYYSTMIKNEKVIFLKPLSFMNLSGDVVKKYVDYYNIDLKDILIIQDDLDLDIGIYRVKYDSSSGGHNGIKSIINRLNSQKFLRLKVGISKNKENIIDYVLSSFSRKDLKVIEDMYSTLNKIIEDFLELDAQSLMNKYN